MGGQRRCMAPRGLIRFELEARLLFLLCYARGTVLYSQYIAPCTSRI